MTLQVKFGSEVGTGTIPAGLPGGAGAPGGPPAPAVGAGWEIQVRAAPDFSVLLAVLPQKTLLGFQFVKQLKDLGSGTVTLDMDDAFWSGTLPNSQPAHYLLDYEHLWQVWQDGVCRFEYLAETVAEQLADNGEQRVATITGPGTAATLKWAMAAPPGFPGAIRYALDAITDGFSETDVNGNLVLDTGLWNAATPANRLSLNPSGSARLVGSPSSTFLGTTAYNATNTLVSAQVAPIVSPDPGGSNLDGSQVTQMYVQSLANSGYYALMGLSGTTFYAQLGGPSGVFTKTIASATAFNTAAQGSNEYQYWMISEKIGTGGPAGWGTFYFWTSGDGQNWTQQWSIRHNWDATDAGLYFTAKYDVDNVQFATVTSINSNVSSSSLGGPVYFGKPIVGGVWLDLLDQAQARGTIPFVQTGRLSASTDSFGNPWTDSQNVQIANGTDLFALLGAHAGMINADWVMQPGFLLQVGIPAAGKVTLGTDRSAQVIFRDGQDCSARVRTRARQSISNLLAVINSDGRTITATDSSSATAWGQREAWLQAAMQVTTADLEAVATAADLENSTEVLSWTLQVSPWRPGRDIFGSYDVGDWVGLERPDFSAVDAVRVAAIAVQVAADGSETHELTLVSYIQWLQEQLTYITTKLGGGFLSATGTTAVSNSTTSQSAPTIASITLGSLGDVTTGGPGGNAPLVYNPVTGQWTPAGGSVPVTVAGPGGQVTIAPDGSSVTVSAPVPPPADGGATATIPVTTTTTPAGTTVRDSTGTIRVIVGQQLDGTFTHTDANGTTPGTPDTPVVAGVASALVVGWDGLLAGASPLADFLWTEVHMSVTTGFTPSAATLQATMHAGGTYTISNLTPGTTYFVKLVAVNTSRAASTPSAQASGIPAAAAGGNKISFQATAPSSPGLNDVWADTSNGNRMEQWNGTAWVTYQFGTQAVSFTAAGIGAQTIYFASTQPASPNSGDLWYNGANGNQLEQYNGTAWVPFQWGTGSIAANSITSALIAANTITAAKIAANTITAAQIAAGTLTATQIASGTITATQIASGTITAALLAAGIVKAGIVDSTTVTGATLQNSSSNPRTSINPDGSVTITNALGVVVFKVGPDGTMSWYNSTGALLMKLEPGGTTLIYEAATGPQSWSFSPAGQPSVLGTATPSTSATSYAVPVTQSSPVPQGSGDGLFLQVFFNAADAVNATAVTDTKGNTWTQTSSVTASEHLQVFQCQNATALTTSDTVTVTVSAATTSVKNVVVTGASGIAPSGALDVKNTANGSGTSASVSVTPAFPEDLLVFAVASAGAPSAVTDGWVQFAQLHTSGAYLTLYYSTTAVHGSAVTPAATVASGAWGASLAAWTGPAPSTANDWATVWTPASFGVSTAWAAVGGPTSLKVTSSGTAWWGVESPAFPAVPSTLQSMQATVYTPAALSALSIQFNWLDNTGTFISSSAGDQGAVSTTAGQVQVLTITGASAPPNAVTARFIVQDQANETAGTAMYIDNVQVAGGLIYSLSPVAGTDNLGNPFDTGLSFTGLPGSTNVFSVKDYLGDVIAKIDGSGNINAKTVSAATDLILGGSSVTALMQVPALGVLAQGTVTVPFPSSGTFSGGQQALFELDQQCTAGRLYRVRVSQGIVDCTSLGGASAPVRLFMDLRYTSDGSTPSTSSTEVAQGSTQIMAINQDAPTPSLEWVFAPSSNTTYRFLVCGYITSSSTATWKLQDDPIYMTIEDLGVNTGVNVSNNIILLGTGGSGGGSSPQSHTEYFYPASTWSYDEYGLKNQNGSMYQGAYSGEGFAQHAWIQWGTGSLGNSLSTVLGYSLSKVSLRLTNLHSWYDSGMTVSLHYGTSLGSLASVSSELASWHISEGNTWDNVITGVGTSLGSSRYTVLHPPSSSQDLSYYGYFYGKGSSQGSEPQLTVSYTH